MTGASSPKRVTAFVGYTACASRFIPRDLLSTPVPIHSLEEYEALYGTWPDLEYPPVLLDASGKVQLAPDPSHGSLYDSIRLFFGNGGQDAVIVSVGVPEQHRIQVQSEALRRGVEIVFEQQEATLLCVPAARFLAADQQGLLYDFILQRCRESQEHFALLEPSLEDPDGSLLPKYLPEAGREFGAAVVPWVLLREASPLDYRQLPPRLLLGTSEIELAGRTTDPVALEALAKFNALNIDRHRIDATCVQWIGDARTLVADVQRRLQRCQHVSENRSSEIQSLFEQIHGLAMAFNAWVSPPAFQCRAVESLIESAVDQTLRFAFAGLISTEHIYAQAMQRRGLHHRRVWDEASLPNSLWWGDSLSGAFLEATNPSVFLEEAPGIELGVIDHIGQVFTACFVVLDAVDRCLTAEQQAAHELLVHTFPFYKNIIRALAEWNARCTASGAVAGMLAHLERVGASGKAQPRIRLHGIEPLQSLTDDRRIPRLNSGIAWGCHVTALESGEENAIDLPPLRTLAGDDSPYRTAATRCRANWLHQRIRLKTQWIAFEPAGPDVASKVHTQLSQFLTELWHQGVLAGTDAREAFVIHEAKMSSTSIVDNQGGRFEIHVDVALEQPGQFFSIRVEQGVR